MAHRLCFSYWSLVCWLVVTVAEGTGVALRPQSTRCSCGYFSGAGIQPLNGNHMTDAYYESEFAGCYEQSRTRIKKKMMNRVNSAKGQEEVVTPPGGSQNNINPTDCQIFTLTPPPTTRNPTTRVPPIPRTPRYPFNRIPQRRPGVYLRFPNRPFLPLKCNHRFQFRPFRWPHGPLTSRRYFLGRNLQTESSSEESREKREA